MKKTVLGVLLIGIVAVLSYIFYFQPQKTISPLSQLPLFSSPTPEMSMVSQKPSQALFVPYWAVGTKAIESTENETLLYFGVSGTLSGIDTTDPGYKQLPLFLTAAQSHEKLLVVRMVNSEINSKVLENKTAQQKIIQDSIAIAKKDGFTGVVLDFEIKALAFDSVIKNISVFYTNFSSQVHKNNLQFDVTLYGDTFYRARPYDVKTIGSSADHVYIMTYDFHKAGGDPGPNFPLSEKEIYGYDLDTMLNDFTKQVTPEKLIVTFGLFGYDWTVDAHNSATTTAVPLSFLEITQKYLNTCSEKKCVVKKDETSLETHISFVDADGKNHVIWFESLESMEKKKEYLKKKGFNATALWAYSYY